MQGLKKTRFLVLLSIGISLLSIGIFLICYIFRPNANTVLNQEPELYINAHSLIAKLQGNTLFSKMLDAEKVVEITGTLKEINNLNNRVTVILNGGKNEHPTIICDMLTSQKDYLQEFSTNDTIVIRGIYKGFLKDAIFLNCIVIHETTK